MFDSKIKWTKDTLISFKIFLSQYKKHEKANVKTFYGKFGSSRKDSGYKIIL